MCLFCNLPQTTYCERGDSSIFWAEPVNALSNVVFMVAGYFSLKLLRETTTNSKELRILSWLLVLVGFGSFSYHTARGPETLLLDALPIYIFVVYAFFVALREVFGSKARACLLLLSFISLEALLSIIVPRDFLNGSIRHVAAMIFVSMIGWLVRKKYGTSILRSLAKVVILYALAIFFRSIDPWICTWLLTGTHFLWHVFAATAGYQAVRLLVEMKRTKIKYS